MQHVNGITVFGATAIKVTAIAIANQNIARTRRTHRATSAKSPDHAPSALRNARCGRALQGMCARQEHAGV